MNSKIRFSAMVIAFVAIAFALAERVFAQHTHRHEIESSWKTGMVRLNKDAYAGNVRLTSGMYHVRHVAEGEKHWLIFKEVTLGAGYRQGTMTEGKEVARVQCQIERAEKSVRNSKVIFSKTSNRAYSIREVQIATEKVRHVLGTTHF